jgi:SAM-dependent methyltransferase
MARSPRKRWKRWPTSRPAASDSLLALVATVTETFGHEHFERIDEGPDSEFYKQPRLVVHIDDGAIRAAGRLYASLLPPNAEILDLMSSWRSHLPEDFQTRRVVGLGMNALELRENPRLTEWVLHDLNQDPTLPFESDGFDGVIDTVSVQYLTRPLEVFAEVYRVLRPGGRFIVTFSNRCFWTKAVRIWRELSDRGHAELIAAYFQQSAAWHDLHAVDCNADQNGGDPLFAVHAQKPEQALASEGEHGHRD